MARRLAFGTDGTGKHGNELVRRLLALVCNNLRDRPSLPCEHDRPMPVLLQGPGGSAARCRRSHRCKTSSGVEVVQTKTIGVSHAKERSLVAYSNIDLCFDSCSSEPRWPEAPGSKLVPDANGRYALAPIDGGVLKLDTRTGAVTECRRTADALNCALAQDERQTMQDEIDRLARDNAELRGKLDGASISGAVKPTPALPSDEDVERALSLMERFLRRFEDIIDNRGTPR